MAEAEDKIFTASEIGFIKDNTKSDKGENCDDGRYDSDAELAELKKDLSELYTKKVDKLDDNDVRKQKVQESKETLSTLGDISDKNAKETLIRETGKTISQTDLGKGNASTYNNEIEHIFDEYATEMGAAVSEFKDQLPHLQMDGEIDMSDRRLVMNLPKNEKQLLMEMAKGTYGSMLTDVHGNELTRESLSKQQKKEVKSFIALVQGVNMSSFFECINAYDVSNKKGLDGLREDFATADIDVLMDAWNQEGKLGRQYAQLAGYKGLKNVERRRLAKLTKKLLDATDTNAATHADMAPIKSLFMHLQASTQQVTIDNKRGRKGAQYNERVQYAQAYLQSKNLENESIVSDDTAGGMLDILVADQDGDMAVDAEAYAHQDKGYKATKGWMYQLFHLKQAKKIREQNKEARSYNKAVKERRKEAAGKQKEVGANILFEGQLKRSLDTARKILNPDGTLSEGEVNTKVLQNLVGLVTQHYEQLVGKNVQIDQSSNILAVLQANRNSSATDILNNIFLKYPQTFGYVRGFLVEHHADAVNIFIDGASYGNIVIDAAKKNDEEEKNLESMNIPEPLLAKLDEEYGELVAVLDRKVTEAKDQGFDETIIQNLEEQQENLNLNRPRRKMQLAVDALTVIASTINHAQGLGLATGMNAQIDNAWIQSIRLGGGLFQGIGGDSVAGTSLGLSLTCAGSRENKLLGGTLMYSLGTGIGANWNALGFLNGFDIGMSLGNEWTINKKTIASNLDPKAKRYFGAGFSASFLHGGIGPHLWLRNDKLLGLQEAEKKLLDPTKSLVEELLSKNCLEDATKQKKTLQVYIYEQLLAKKEGTSGDKQSSKLFRKTTNATLENASRNLAVGLMTYYTNPDFASLSSNAQKKAQVAESIARHHLLHWSMEHMEDLKQGLGSLHVSAFDIGLQIVASGPAPLKIVGGTLTRYKDGYWSEDYQSREQVEQIKEEGRDARELPGSFGSAIELYNKLLDAGDGTFTEEMKLTSTLVEHAGKQYPAVRIPPALFDYLRDHDGGVVMHKLEMVFMKKDDEGAYISADAPSNLFVIPTSGKNEYQLVVGGVDGVRKGQEQQNDKNKVLYTQFDQIGESIRSDGEGFAQRDVAVQEVSKDKYEVQLQEKMKQFMSMVNTKCPGFFTQPNEKPLITLDGSMIGGVPGGTVKLSIDPSMRYFGGTPSMVKTDGGGAFIEVSLNGLLAVTKSTAPGEVAPWQMNFVPETKKNTGLVFSYGESTDSFTKKEAIASEGFNLEAVQPQLLDYLKSRDGAEKMLEWRYKDAKRTPNGYHDAFYNAIEAKNYSAAAEIARRYISNTEITLDSSVTGLANIYTLYAELSRVDMTEFKDVKNMQEAKRYAGEQLTALVSANRISSADKVTIESIIQAIFDSPTPVTAFYAHQSDIQRILKVKYGDLQYNRDKKRDDPAYKLTYLLAPASVVDKTRTTKLKEKMQGEGVYKDGTIKNDFMEKRDQIFASMDSAQVMANQGTPQKNSLGLVFGYGSNHVDEKIIAHPPMMDFPGSQIVYDKNNLIEKQHVQYFVENVKEKNSEYLLQDMQGMITYLQEQLQKTNLLPQSRQKLEKALSIFQSNATNLDEIASLWQTGKFTNKTLPEGITSVKKAFAQTKYPKCINDMIIARPTVIELDIETISTTTITPKPVGLVTIEPYTFGKAHVTTGVIGHRMTKDARTINVLTSHGNLEKSYDTVTVESTTEISDLDTYLAGLTQEQRDAFIAKLGTEIQPGIELDLGLGQGLQTYDGWVIDANIWVVQDNSGTLPTMRLVNVVTNEIINTAVLTNREQSFIVKSNALAAQNLRKLGIMKSPQQVHAASPIEERDPAQQIPKYDTQSLGNAQEKQDTNVPNVLINNGVLPEILTAKDDFTSLENQETYLTPESVYGYIYQLGKNTKGATVLRISKEGDKNTFIDLPVTDIHKINEEIANKLITVGDDQIFVDVYGKNVTIMPVSFSHGEKLYTAPNNSLEAGVMNPTWQEVPNEATSPGTTGTINTIQYKDTQGNTYVVLNKELYKVNNLDSDNITYEKMN